MMSNTYRCCIACCFYVLAIIIPRTGYPAEALKLEAGHPVQILNHEMDVIPDPAGNLTFEMVSSAAMSGRFVRPSSEKLVALQPGYAYWIRFQLAPVDGPAEEGLPLLELDAFSVILNRVDLYVPQNNASGAPLFSRSSTGIMVPPGPGDIRSRHFIFELPGSAMKGGYCYLRIENGGRMLGITLNIRYPLELRNSEALYYSLFGIIYGILLSMVLYNFFIFITLRDSTYLYYILYILSGILWQFWVQGHAKMFQFQIRGWDLALVWIFVGSMLQWGAIFSIRFLGIKKNLPRIYLALVLFGSLGTLSMIAGFFKLHTAAFYISHACGLILPFIAITAAAFRLRQGFKPARYYMLAWVSLTAGGFLFTLMGLNIVPVNFWTVNGVATGMTAEAILLALALADRIRSLREEKDYYQKTQQRYLELSITDGLTGLYNKRFLLSKLASEIEHTRRLDQPLSLIAMDLDNFKILNDRYGHATGDSVLVQLAGTIRSCIRGNDIACRSGGEEFVIIMPGTKLPDTFTVAERIRIAFSRDLITTPDKKSFSATISIGVVELGPADDIDAFMDRADRAMYDAKSLGKNRTVTA